MSPVAVENAFLPASCMLQPVHGRPLAVNSDYYLPIDAEEHTRLDLQHEILKKVIGGLYTVPELVQKALAPKPRRPIRILDVGTGSGAWAIDMAKEFPHCEVVGIDLVPPTLLPNHPRNLRFKACDANFPLPMETASFDLVHARLVDQGIRNYPAWLSEVSRVTRPGGLYLVLHMNSRAVQEDGFDFPIASVGEPGYTGYQSMLWAVRRIMKSRIGPNPSNSWMAMMSANGNFGKMAKDDYLVPITPWQEDANENTRIIGQLMQQNTIDLFPALKPILLREGHGAALVDKWIRDTISEVLELRLRGFVRLETAWCTRSADDWKAPRGGLGMAKAGL